VINYHNKLQEELRGCTFQPQITDYDRHVYSRQEDCFYERSKVWMGEKERKILLEREEQFEDIRKQ
jgi:hypothetical protein